MLQHQHRIITLISQNGIVRYDVTLFSAFCRTDTLIKVSAERLKGLSMLRQMPDSSSLSYF